jgi:hypothetical protein
LASQEKILILKEEDIMPGSQGLSEVEAGQMWAKAFTDGGFRGSLEDNPRAAAETLFPGLNPPPPAPPLPLLNSRKTGSYSLLFFTTLNADFSLSERQKIRNQDIDGLIASSTSPSEQSRLRNLKSTLKGNTFEFREKGTTNVYLVEQNIDGPMGANLPLTRNQWIRVYARAHNLPDFRNALEFDPKQAIDSLPASFSLGHNTTAKIFFVPTAIDLLNALPTSHPLKNDFDQLEKELQDIVTDPMTADYECLLRINLSC